MIGTKRSTPPAARVLSLGAGVQSSALAVMAARGDLEPPDFAVFADTQAEPASVYTWLDKLERIVQSGRYPFPVVRCTQGDLGAAQLRIKTKGPNSLDPGATYTDAMIPAFADIGVPGKPGLFGRKCTRDFKLYPILRAIRQHLGVYKKRSPEGWWVEQWIGISTDEASRMKPSRDHWLTNRWPLIELRISRTGCNAYLKDLGLEAPRSACTFCPFHSPEEWRRLRDDEPAEFAKAAQFERDLQDACASDDSTSSIPYLSRYCRPLEEIDWAEKADENSSQLNMFQNECEGMCGV